MPEHRQVGPLFRKPVAAMQHRTSHRAAEACQPQSTPAAAPRLLGCAALRWRRVDDARQLAKLQVCKKRVGSKCQVHPLLSTGPTMHPVQSGASTQQQTTRVTRPLVTVQVHCCLSSHTWVSRVAARRLFLAPLLQLRLPPLLQTAHLCKRRKVVGNDS